MKTIDEIQDKPKFVATPRKMEVDEDGVITIICHRHYYGDKNRATDAQRQYFWDLGGIFSGCKSNNQYYKCVTKIDMSAAINFLKEGKKVEIFI